MLDCCRVVSRCRHQLNVERSDVNSLPFAKFQVNRETIVARLIDALELVLPSGEFTAIPRIFALVARPEIAAAIVEFVPIYVIDVHARLGSHDEPVQGDVRVDVLELMVGMPRRQFE
jgi:hypothetical protein